MNFRIPTQQIIKEASNSTFYKKGGWQGVITDHGNTFSFIYYGNGDLEDLIIMLSQAKHDFENYRFIYDKTTKKFWLKPLKDA